LIVVQSNRQAAAIGLAVAPSAPNTVGRDSYCLYCSPTLQATQVCYANSASKTAPTALLIGVLSLRRRLHYRARPTQTGRLLAPQTQTAHRSYRQPVRCVDLAIQLPPNLAMSLVPIPVSGPDQIGFTRREAGFLSCISHFFVPAIAVLWVSRSLRGVPPLPPYIPEKCHKTPLLGGHFVPSILFVLQGT
jgi:hypothetical protein